MRKPLVIVGVVIIIGLVIVAGFSVVTRLTAPKSTLTIWTLDGTQAGIKAITDRFTATNPSASVKIVSLKENSYEFKFLYALAAGQPVEGIAPPDLLVLPNETLPLHRSKLVAAPEGVLDSAVQGYVTSATAEQSSTPKLAKGRTNTAIINQDFGPIVGQDLTEGDQVFGVPLNSDTLAMFYNKSLVPSPPKTWEEVVTVAKSVTQKAGSTITRSGVALGDAKVRYAPDLTSILMLQNGATMVKPKESMAAFNLELTSGLNPGARALDFYTSFNRQETQNYAWSSSLGDSISALNSGKAAIAFGYAVDGLNLKSSSLAVAPLPQVQIASPQTYGRYLSIGVTKQAANPQLAWKLAAAFANPQLAKEFATVSKLIPARLDVAKSIKLSSQQQVFADQISQAVSWPKQEVAIADGAITEAINLVLNSRQSAADALDVAAKAYTAFLQTDSGLVTDASQLSLFVSRDDSTDYKALATDYLGQHKEITKLVVSRHDANRFEWELLNAMAARLGPDLAAVPSELIARLKHVINPFPIGAFKPSEVKAGDSEVAAKLFVPSVSDSNVIKDRMYGVPLYVETLYLAYNRELFRQLEDAKLDDNDPDYQENSRLFDTGPTTWADLTTMSRLATKRNGLDLSLPFIALGTGTNVVNSSDIYAAFVKQAGGDINNPDKIRSGIQLPISSRDSRIPGQEALEFIHGFSDPQERHYSWNQKQPNSLEAFADGKVMSVLVYPRDVDKILARNPNMSIGYFPLPQIDDVSSPVDFASNFSLTISKVSNRSDVSMSLIKGIIKKRQDNRHASSLKVEESVATRDRSSMSQIQSVQAASGVSYFFGNHPTVVRQALVDLLDKKLTLSQAAAKLNQTLPKGVFD